MLKFVNAKLNLGLNIVGKRPDGYHNLETIFYPIGLYNGTPQNPEAFCDILEIKPTEKTEFIFSGRQVDCPLEKNLVYKAWKLFKGNYPQLPEYIVHLEKHLPDGAGMGGGSADASFVLRVLNEMNGKPFSDTELAGMALQLGADCPFFIYNRPCYAAGVGEKLTPLELDLSGFWCALVKPELSISTKEAFAGVTPTVAETNLQEIARLPIEAWRGKMKNDFEESLFPNHHILGEIKQKLIDAGALYAAMSGSGSTIFGIFKSRSAAAAAVASFPEHFTTVCLM